MTYMKTMTSRERVQRCLCFDHPDRPPRDLWLLPSTALHHGQETVEAFRQRWPADICQVPGCRPAPRKTAGDPYAVGTATDEWGCVFENVLPGVHGEVKHPLLEDWVRLEDLAPPEELLAVDTAAVNAFCRDQERYVFASGWARPFERMQFLRGTENLFYDFAEEGPELQALIDLVHDFYRRQYEIWATTEVDALVMMDDWGSQISLLISPDQWRRLFKPLYAEYATIAHDHGKAFFMHSDGCIQDIYPDLVEIGIDAVNSQLFCMDFDRLAATAKDHLTFWGEIDRQHILPHGSPQEVRQAVEKVYDTLHDPAGGVIAQFSWEGATPLANAEAVYEAWEALTTHTTPS